MLKIYLVVIGLLRRFPLLHGMVWKMRRKYRAIERMFLVRRPVVYTGDIIKNAILEGKPFATGKIGKYEALGVSAYLRREEAKKLFKKVPSYPSYTQETLFVNAGVFPRNESVYDRFNACFLDAIKECDALAAWDIEGETEIFRFHCPQAILSTMQSLEPYYSEEPWSAALEGKRVLVISPFVDSIRAQYGVKGTLWNDLRVLPSFEMLFVRPPFSAGIVVPKALDWFEALADLKAQMDALNYDVAIIGAGAFSLPLAVHAKNKGKVGIHMGGATQTLFGIVGKRWLLNPNFKKNSFIKDSWKSPIAAETPEAAAKIENGCYW